MFHCWIQAARVLRWLSRSPRGPFVVLAWQSTSVSCPSHTACLLIFFAGGFKSAGLIQEPGLLSSSQQQLVRPPSMAPYNVSVLLCRQQVLLATSVSLAMSSYHFRSLASIFLSAHTYSLPSRLVQASHLLLEEPIRLSSILESSQYHVSNATCHARPDLDTSRAAIFL